MDDGTRINRYISQSGVCSRREADRLIEEGRVTIDGRTAVLGDRVTEGSSVFVDGRDVSPVKKKVYIALNKPRGIVCTADPREKYNVVSYIGYPERIYPVGRLDKDSEGLLLLTNDGDIVNRVLRTANGHEKEYQVTVSSPVTDDFLHEMASGVPILGTKTLPCRIRRTGEKSFDIILVQGLNRQIRRMCEYFGKTVVSLRRVRIMDITIGELKPGEWRLLTEKEIASLNELE